MMLALFIPWILLFLIIVTLLSLFKRWYRVSGLLLVVALIVNWHWQVFAFGFNSLSDKKEDNVLRVMTWNVNRADSLFWGKDKDLAETIKGQNADVIFLTEFNPSIYNGLNSILKSTFAYDDGAQKNWTHNAVFSNIPIKICETWNDTIHFYSYELILENDTIGLYPVHLQSNNRLTPSENFYPEDIQNQEGLSRYLKAYEVQSRKRVLYAEFICGRCKGPSIVMGDFNDVYSSPVMSFFENAGLKNAWWEGGFGYGATFHNPLPYRIDHILYSNCLKLKGIRKIPAEGLSDHDALVADFEIK